MTIPIQYKYTTHFCNVCGMYFTYDQLIGHHSFMEKYNCPRCKHGFVSKNELDHHLIDHYMGDLQYEDEYPHA